MPRFLDRQRSAPISPKVRKAVSWASETKMSSPAGEDDRTSQRRPKALSIAVDPRAAVASEGLPVRRSGSLKGKLEALHRARIAAHQQHGEADKKRGSRASDSSVPLRQEVQALKEENETLRRENGALVRENALLTQRANEALEESRVWSQESKVMQDEYTQAFLEKTEDIFEKTLALEHENNSLRRDNEVLKKACTDAAAACDMAAKENKAWQHENKVLHEEYKEHLAQSVEVLKENTALKGQIAVSNKEYSRITESNKAYIKELMGKVGQALGENVEVQLVHNKAAPVSSGGRPSVSFAAFSSNRSVETLVPDWGEDEHVPMLPRSEPLQSMTTCPQDKAVRLERTVIAKIPSGEAAVGKLPVPTVPRRPLLRRASLDVSVELTGRGSLDTLVGDWKDSPVARERALSERRGVRSGANTRASTGHYKRSFVTSEELKGVGETQPRPDISAWKRDNKNWMEATRAWQQANKVLKRALSMPRDVGIERAPKGENMKILALPQRLTIKLENRAFRARYVHTVKASQLSPRPAATDDDFSDGSTDEGVAE